MIVALSAPAVFGAAGFAVDYGYASYIKRSLDQAADAAALAATSQSAAAAGGGYTNTSNLRTYGVNTFNGNIARLNLSLGQGCATPLASGTWCMTVNSNGTGGVVSSASYSYTVPTYFSSLLGIPTIPIAGSATATANPVTYIDYYILLDISQSMGIASTQTDMNNLYARTKAAGNEGCVFGCHVAQAGDPAVNESLAHNQFPRITLRIDAAITAIQNIIADAQTASGSTKAVRIGLYTMSYDPASATQKLTVISAPTSDYTTLTTLASAITLGNNTSNGIGDTDYTTQFANFNAQLPATNGAGVVSSAPKNYVFLITDGINDTTTGCLPTGHCSFALNPNSCAQFKTKATVGTIYTTYLPIYFLNNSTLGYDSRYTLLVANYASQIAPNMQSCATNSSLYYQANDGPGINTAMKALFASTLTTARLTQ